MNQPHVDVFRPVDGAVLDLASLQAIATAHDRLLAATLNSISPGTQSIVLHGLEPQGDWASAGPPGTIRPDARSEELHVSAGSAIIQDRNGQHSLVQVNEPLSVKWPNRAGPGVNGQLVLMPEEIGAVDQSIQFARTRIRLVLGFVKPGVPQPFLLPLASAVGNGKDWMTDVGRLWQPEHAPILSLLKQFEHLERLVWRAEPEGSVWDRQVMGRNWVRYQTMAAAAIQAARMTLQARASTTTDRVRILSALFRALHGSVEQAALELLQIVGAGEGSGPYQSVGAHLQQGE